MQLRMQYVQKQHEFVFALHRAKEPHMMDRTPDDALRYQSVMFALIRALDKVTQLSPLRKVLLMASWSGCRPVSHG